MITTEQIYERLNQVMDPETNLSLVAMGLIYDVKVLTPDQTQNGHVMVQIRYTLTTPGCPLAGSFQYMIRSALADLANDDSAEAFDSNTDISLELTFDPPWSLESMSESARAELGF